MTGKRKSLKKRKPLSDKPDKTLLKRDIAALAEATGQLPPDPFPHQLGISGWLEPDLTPKLVAEALDNSLMEYEIDPVAAMIWARYIYDSSLEGAELETPGERATTEVKAQKELENLHKLLCQLERELGRIGRPANQILFANRCDPQLLKKVVSNAANASEEGLKYYNVPEHVAFAESAGGRPPKEKARLVTDTTAMAFEALTRRRAG